ncbi:MAG: PAS domain S-box protein [Bacillota bacterium]
MNNPYQKIKNLNKLKTGDHVVLIYEKENEYIKSIISFVKESLKRDEKCLYIDDKKQLKKIKKELFNQINNLENYIQKGQLLLLSKEETYAADNNFDSDQMIELIKEETNKALDEGYNGLSITGELNEVLNFENGKKEIIDYEWKLNHRVFNYFPVVALCRYDINKYDNDIIKAVIELHPYLILENELYSNPYYIDAEAYKDNKIEEYEINSWLENIKEYKKLFDFAPVGIFRTTSNGEVLSANKTMAEILGFKDSNEALSAYNDLQKELYADSSRRDEFIKALENEGKVENFEYEAVIPDGENIWLNMNAKISEREKNEEFIIEGYVFDITERKKFQEELKSKKQELFASNMQLSAYNEEIKAMNEELEQSFEEMNKLNQRFVDMIELVANMEDKTLLDEEEFFSELLGNAIEIVPEADYGKIGVINKEDEFKIVDAIGHNSELINDLKIDKDKICHIEKKGVYKSNGHCIKYGEMSISEEEILNKVFKPIKESLCVNIRISNKTVARISLDIKENSDQEFSKITKKILKSFANLASAFFAFKRFDKLRTNFTKELVTSIINLMEMYDIYTTGHSQNVAKLASKVAEKMNLPKKLIKDTYWAGLVHDIGKLLVPLNILNKEEKLSAEEYELIKKHPVYGQKALVDSESLEHISKYVLHHHERWDGKGYPEGLKGNDIPLISQILTIVDAWDAMLSKRAYREPLTKKEAINEIKENKGTQFSPKIVDYFLEIIKNEKTNLVKAEVINDELEENKIKSEQFDKVVSFKKFFEESQEGIVLLDDEFNIIETNNYFKDMFNFKEGEIAGANIKKIVPENKYSETNNYIKKLKKGNRVDSTTYRKKKNGEYIEVSIQAFPLTTSGNSVIGYYIIYRDISELKEAKRKYENVKDRYKSLFENNYTMMLIIDPENGNIIDANPAAVDFYGWNKEKLTSMKITEINTLSEKEVKEEMDRAKKEDKLTFEFKHEIANGEIKDIKVYSQPISFGDDDYLYSIFRDVTEKKKAQEKLKRQKEFSQNILDSLAANIVILDENGVIKYTNKAWRNFAENNGENPKNVGIGTNYLEVIEKAKNIQGEKTDKVYQGIKDVMNGDKDEFELEYPCHSPDKKRWFKMRVSDFKNDGPYSVVIYHENITDWKKPKDRNKK